MPGTEAQSTHSPTGGKNIAAHSNQSSVTSSHNDNIVKSRPKTEENGQVSTHKHGEAIEYVSGWKLVIVIASIALSCFLMLLDTMIISTVSETIDEEPL